jgi:hypothetical protein
MGSMPLGIDLRYGTNNNSTDGDDGNNKYLGSRNTGRLMP